MSQILVVVFDTEQQAHQGTESLQSLQEHGSLSIHSMSLITKEPGGRVAVKEVVNPNGARGILVGMLTGALLGLLGGPMGLAAGATVGIFGGAVYAGETAENARDFLDEVTRKLRLGKSALVAEVEEGSEQPVDARMQAAGAILLLRRTPAEIVDSQRSRDAAAIQADRARREKTDN